MELSDDAVAAINAAFADPEGGWAFTSATVDVHSQLLRVGMELVNIPHRAVTVTAENEALGRILIITLEGQTAPASEASIILHGTKMTTANEELITRCEGAVTALQAAMQAAVVDYFTQPTPES